MWQTTIARINLPDTGAWVMLEVGATNVTLNVIWPRTTSYSTCGITNTVILWGKCSIKRPFYVRHLKGWFEIFFLQLFSCSHPSHFILEMGSKAECTAFAESWAWFPAPAYWLPTTCNSNSRGPDIHTHVHIPKYRYTHNNSGIRFKASRT